jgi:hypothetical protein
VIKIKLGGYVDETGKIMNKQELDEHILMLQENLAIAIEALKMYADPSYPKELTEIARDALVKISANNIVTKYHNTLNNLKD